MKLKKSVMSLITFGAVLSAVPFSVMTASAEEDSSNAYIFLADSDGNTFEDAASDAAAGASVNKDGSYSVSISSDVSQIVELQLKLELDDNNKGNSELSVSIDSVKIDDKEVALENEVKSEANDSELYVPIIDQNNNDAAAFDTSAYQNIKSISIDFTVSGWKNEEETTAAETEKETESATEAAAAEENNDSTTTGHKNILFANTLFALCFAAAGISLSVFSKKAKK